MSTSHLLASIDCLALFHSFGLIARYKYPQNYQEIIQDVQQPLLIKEGFEASKKIFFETLKSMPKFQKYQSFLEDVVSEDLYYKYNTEDELTTVVHSDIYTSNILFLENEAGKILDVKLIDFQLLKIMNPIRDLVYLLCTSCRIDIKAEELNEAVNFYYDRLRYFLERANCSLKISREWYDRKVRIIAFSELMRLIISLRFTTLQINSKNNRYSKRLERVLQFYEDQNWLNVGAEM